jgi:hypothetical protein
MALVKYGVTVYPGRTIDEAATNQASDTAGYALDAGVDVTVLGPSQTNPTYAIGATPISVPGVNAQYWVDNDAIGAPAMVTGDVPPVPASSLPSPWLILGVAVVLAVVVWALADR